MNARVHAFFFEGAKFSSIGLMGDRCMFIITMVNKYISSHLYVALLITIILLVTIKTKQPDLRKDEIREQRRREVQGHRTDSEDLVPTKYGGTYTGSIT
jgi:hypothetical protein